MQAITTVGLDLAKSVFQVHGIDAENRVIIRRQLKRRYVLPIQAIRSIFVPATRCLSWGRPDMSHHTTHRTTPHFTLSGWTILYSFYSKCGVVTLCGVLRPICAPLR